MTAINWPLLILTDSPEFSRKLAVAGMVRMCRNEAKVTNKRSDGNWGNMYRRDLPHSDSFLLSEYHLFYLEVNLMPYGFLFMIFTYSLFIGLCSASSNMTGYSHSCHSIKLVHCSALQRDVLSDKIVF